MPNLTFYGGVSEIGGTKILFQHKDTRIFLDFGMSFKLASDYFSEFLQPRKCSALEDFFEFKLLPDIKGIYREDYLRHMGRRPEKKDIHAVLLSHAHADHAQYIHFLRHDIPIYCSQETKIILRAVEETGSNPISDLVTSCESFTFYTNKTGGLSRVDRRKKEYVKNREYNVLRPDERIKIGEVEVEMVTVDHSMPGACGFIVYTDQGNLVYTGDVRFHGYRKEASEEFVKRSRDAKPAWFLCEGTRIDKEELDSEELVRKKIAALISNARGIAFIEHPIRDLFRVKSIYEAAKANKRDFVVNLKLAYLIRALGDHSPIQLSQIKVLIPRKSWGLISKEIDLNLIEQDYEKWEREFIGKENSLTFLDLQKNPAKYVVSMNIWELNQLTDIKPENAIWIKSTCEPFNEEMEVDEQRKKNWLNHFKIREYQAHASGHASRKELVEIIKSISPARLFPIHTENPTVFKKLLKGTGINITMPALKETYSL